MFAPRMSSLKDNRLTLPVQPDPHNQALSFWLCLDSWCSCFHSSWCGDGLCGWSWSLGWSWCWRGALWSRVGQIFEMFAPRMSSLKDNRLTLPVQPDPHDQALSFWLCLDSWRSCFHNSWCGDGLCGWSWSLGWSWCWRGALWSLLFSLGGSFFGGLFIIVQVRC